MKTLILALIGALALSAQSFPTSIYTPLVAGDNIQSALTSPMLAGDAVAIMASTTGWQIGMVAYICEVTTGTGTATKCTSFEAMLVTNVATNVLTVTRAYGGTTAIAHATGKIVANAVTAVYNKKVNDEVLALETFLGVAGANVALAGGANAFTGANTHSNTETFNGALNAVGTQTNTGAVNARGATHTSPAQTGISSAKPGTCTAGDQYFATDVTAGQNLFLCTAANTWTQTTTLPAASAALQQLRIKPNTGNITTSEFANPALVNALDYNYPAQTPGGSLTATVGALVTLTPCPLGVLATDTRLRFYISGGTGTAESVASTGSGTCTSGAASGTVAFTPANTHSGAWTISSSHAGIYEAIAANPYREIRLPLGTYTMRDCMTLDPNKSLILTGDGYDPAGVTGTILAFASVTSATGCANTSAISVTVAVGYPINPITIRNMLIVGGGAATPVINGLSFDKVTRVNLDNIMVSGFAGNCIVTTNSFEVQITNRTYVQLCGNWGASINGTANLVKITDSVFAFNSRLNGLGNVLIAGNAAPNVSAAVYLQGNAMEGAGTVPFTAVTSALGASFSNTTSLTLIGNYFEANVGGSPSTQVLYGVGITGLTEIGNLISDAGTAVTSGITYDATVTGLNSFGNTFYGTDSTRVFGAANPTTYSIGPDTCLVGSTECTAHPRLLGVGPVAIQQAVSTSNLVLTTSNVDIPNVTLTLNRAGTYQITSSVQFVDAGATDVGQLFVAQLMTNGTLQTNPPYAVWTSSAAGSSATASQTWVFTATAAGQVVKMQARKLGGTGTSYALSGNCTITAVWAPQ